jgi:hypothetical protein
MIVALVGLLAAAHLLRERGAEQPQDAPILRVSSVGCDRGGQSCQQPAQGLGSVALEPEQILELSDHPFYVIWRLPEAQERRSDFGHALQSPLLGVAATSVP